jgi:lipid-A-disaccharide synthase
VGHPLLDTLVDLPSRETARAALGLQPGEQLLLVLPASRTQELRYLLPPLAAAAAELQRRLPGLRVMVPPHIGAGTRVVISTEDNAYVERARD